MIASSTVAKRLRCFLVPSSERPGKSGGLRITEQVRDLADRNRQVGQIALGRIPTRQVEQLLVRDTRGGKTALE